MVYNNAIARIHVSRLFLGTFIFLPLIFVTGCFYSFTGSLPSHVKNVAVPLFENSTSFSGVNQDLTNKVVDQFVEDNTLEVTGESKADIIISGTIGSIIQRPAILSSGETAEQVETYQMVVNVKVKCEDIQKNKVLWEKTISEFGDMSAAGSIDEQNAAIEVALDRITLDILNNTLGYW
jgi:hypothetical protein